MQILCGDSTASQVMDAAADLRPRHPSAARISPHGLTRNSESGRNLIGCLGDPRHPVVQLHAKQ